MGYSKDIYQKARKILDASRSRAQLEAEQRRTQLYAHNERLGVIERQLAETGIAAAKAAVIGGQDAPRLIEQLRVSNLALQNERTKLLKQAGFSPNDLEPQYACEVCKDTGYVGQVQCRCFSSLLRKLSYQKLSDSSCAEECRFQNFRLDYYPEQSEGPYKIVPRRAMEKVFSYCITYAKNFSDRSESLLLCGSTGLGKTHLSLAIAYEVIKNGFGVVYIPSQRLLEKLQAQQFARGGADGTDYQNLALSCDLLIIDDLGAEFSTSFTVAALYHIINSRLIEHRPTIISTNFDEQILRERYGDRILSRLLCSYRPLQFYGEDIRMLKRFSEGLNRGL